MSKFVEDSNSAPKTKIGKYRELSRKVRAARLAMYAAERQITQFVDEYRLEDGKASTGNSCITKFNKVCIDAPVTAHIDDAGYAIYCPLFSDKEICADGKCKWYTTNVKYITAVNEYVVARQARRDFIKGLFRSK